MRYLKYTVETEFSDKTGFAINLTVSVLVIYFILQFFGAYKATAKNMFEGSTHIAVSATVNEVLPVESYFGLKNLKGYLNMSLTCGEVKTASSDTFALYGIMENIPEELLPEGTPIADNAAENALYVPDFYAEATGKNIGDTVYFLRHKANGAISVFDETSGNTDDINKEVFDVIPLIITGTYTNGGDGIFYVPLNTVLVRFTVTEANIVFDRTALTESEYNDVLKEIENTFGNADDSSTDFDKVYANKLMVIRIEAMILFMLGMMCIVFLYSFILSKRVRRFSVCRLCGASKMAVIFIITAGCLMTYIISFGLALFLGLALNYGIFIPVLGYDSFDLSECGTLFILTFVIYLAVMTVYIFKFIKNSAVSIYRRSD